MDISKQEQYKNLLKFWSAFSIWSLLTAIWAYIWMKYYADDILRPFGYKGNWLVITVYGVLLFLFTMFYGGYRVGHCRKDDVYPSNIIALFFTNGVTYLQTSLIVRALVPPRPFIMMMLIDLVLVWMWSNAVHALYVKIFPPHKMLLIYGGTDIAKSLISKVISRSEKYSIQEVVSIQEGLSTVCDKIDGFNSVILCDIPAKTRNRLLKYCFSKSVRTYTTPKISDILIRGGVNISLLDTPLLLNRNQGLNYQQKLFKRLVDLIFSMFVLLLASPFMILTALAIKVSDGGPVFFLQKRCTIHNREFMVIKFRSMIVDAEGDGKPRPAVDGDPRITPVGRFIRATRLDELPQLFNILKGDMSLVGPRPERVEHVLKYTSEIPEFSFRSKVKAGLTGYAQIVGRYNTSAYDKLKMDLMYIANYSIVEDIKIIMMTIKIMFVKSSTEGFSEPLPTSVVQTVDK